MRVGLSRKLFFLVMPLIGIASLAYPQPRGADTSGVITVSVSGVSGVPGPFTPRVFTRGSFVYLVEPSRIVFLSMDTRSSHVLYAAPDGIFNITDAVRSGDMIWAANAAGAVMAVNMQTGSIEEYGRSRTAPGGRIDADSRYLWLAADSVLFRMDMVSREWVTIPIPKSGGDDIRALVTFNDRVHVIASKSVRVYRPASGDWLTAPHRDFALGAGDFYRVNNILYFTHGKTLYRYDPSKTLWNASSARGDIRAADVTADRITVADENRVYRYHDNTFSLEPQPRIPMLRGISSITRHNDRAVYVIEGGLAFFNTPFDYDFTQYPGGINPGDGAFAFSYYDHIILYTAGSFFLYHPGRKLWSAVRIAQRNGAPAGKSGWDEDGARGYFREDYSYELFGTATLRQMPSYSKVPNEGGEADYGTPFVNGTVTLSAEDTEGRVLDLTLDNAVTTLPPQKGLYYKGIDGDIFDRASVGVQGTGMTPGQVMPGVAAEGASAVFSGREAADGRDRAAVSGSAGAGFVLSKTEWRTHGYNSGGTYSINDGGEIIPGSVKVYVDGAALSGTDYVYDPARREVRILRRDKTDPTSAIQISFSARRLPDERTKFEPLPENHFGQYGFVEGTVSPRQWLSAHAGVLAMDGGESGPTVVAGAPVEWRSKENNRAVLLNPEVAYDAQMGTHAAGVELGARENNAFGSYKGYWASRDYSGIDRRSFTNDKVGDEHELDFGYDIRDDLRAVWSQRHRTTDAGDMSQFELRANYLGGAMPDIEISAASRNLERAGDAGRDSKESFGLRLSDMSSEWLAKKSGAHNAGYEFSLSEYRGNENRNGRVLYGMASVSPVERLTLVGTGVYRDNPYSEGVINDVNPALSVRMRDLPKGLDMEAEFSPHLFENSNGTFWLGARKTAAAYVYPGEYIEALGKFALYLAYFDHIEAEVAGRRAAVEQSLTSKGDIYSRDTRETAGLLFLPTENLLLSTVNSRERAFHEGWIAYTSRERAKLWFESGSSVEGTLEIVMSEFLLNLHGDAVYEHRWNETVMTGLGGFAVRREENGIVANIHGGPRFIAAITKNFSGFIRSIENSHAVSTIIDTEEKLRPDIHYAQYLRIKMPPNISIVGELNIESYRLRRIKAGGGLYLHAGF